MFFFQLSDFIFLFLILFYFFFFNTKCIT